MIPEIPLPICKECGGEMQRYDDGNEIGYECKKCGDKQPIICRERGLY